MVEKKLISINEIEKICNIQNKLMISFSFLSNKYGYSKEPAIAIKESNILRFWIEYNYTNQKIGRVVSIIFFPYDQDGHENYSFSISILKTPYKSLNDFLSFDQFLLKKNIDRSTLIFSLPKKTESSEKKAQVIISHIAKSLNLHGKNLIQGKEWLENCFEKW